MTSQHAANPFQDHAEPSRPVVGLLRRTVPAPSAAVARCVAGAPFVVDAMNTAFHPPTRVNAIDTFRTAGFDSPVALLWTIATAQLLAGLLLIPGILARLGAILAVAIIVLDLYTRIAVSDAVSFGDTTPQQGWSLPVALIILAAALYTLVRGAGAWSSDNTATRAAT